GTACRSVSSSSSAIRGRACRKASAVVARPRAVASSRAARLASGVPLAYEVNSASNWEMESSELAAIGWLGTDGPAGGTHQQRRALTAKRRQENGGTPG